MLKMIVLSMVLSNYTAVMNDKKGKLKLYVKFNLVKVSVPTYLLSCSNDDYRPKKIVNLHQMFIHWYLHNVIHIT